MLVRMAKKSSHRRKTAYYNMRIQEESRELWKFVAQRRGLEGNVTAWLTQLAMKDCEPFLAEFAKHKARLEREE